MTDHPTISAMEVLENAFGLVDVNRHIGTTSTV
jgi:hypothetical protein